MPLLTYPPSLFLFLEFDGTCVSAFLPCHDVSAAWKLGKRTFLGGWETEQQLTVDSKDSGCEAKVGRIVSTEMQHLRVRIVSQGIVDGFDRRNGIRSRDFVRLDDVPLSVVAGGIARVGCVADDGCAVVPATSIEVDGVRRMLVDEVEAPTRALRDDGPQLAVVGAVGLCHLQLCTHIGSGGGSTLGGVGESQVGQSILDEVVVAHL